MSYDSGQSVASSQWKIGEVFTIIIVWSIFFIFIYYGLFKRVFLLIYRAITTRNQVQRQLLDESNSNPRDPSLQLESSGLDLSVVHTLPMSKFKKNEGEQKRTNADCAICLGEFEEGEWLKHLPYCTHVFHASCIDTWFQSHSNCPLCRSDNFSANIDHMPSSDDIFHSL